MDAGRWEHEAEAALVKGLGGVGVAVRGGRSITYVRPRFDTNRSWIVVTEFTPTPSNWVPSMIAGWLVSVSFAKHHPKLPFYFSPTHSTKLRFGAQTRGRIRLLFF